MYPSLTDLEADMLAFLKSVIAHSDGLIADGAVRSEPAEVHYQEAQKLVARAEHQQREEANAFDPANFF
jgi:hypothetical protein